MNHDDLVGVLKDMKLWPLQPTGDAHYLTHCFYAESRHDKGYDRRASSTISHSRGTSWFTCFACGTTKPFHDVISDLALKNPGTGLYQLSLKIEKLDKQAPKEVKLLEAPDRNYGKELMELMKNDFSPNALALLTEKGVDLEFARKKFKICFMPKGYQSDNTKDPCKYDAIFFPLLVRTGAGKLKCIGGQARPLGGYTKYFYPFPCRGRGHLYGEHLGKEIANQDVFLEEGMFDVIHTWQEDFCALGAMGTGFSGADASLLKRLNPARAFIFMDNDSAGKKGAERIEKALAHVNIENHNCEHDVDPKYCGAKVFKSFVENV